MTHSEPYNRTVLKSQHNSVCKKLLSQITLFLMHFFFHKITETEIAVVNKLVTESPVLL